MLVLETPDPNNLIILLSHLALASFAFLPVRRNHPPRATLFKTNQPIQRPHLSPPPTSDFHTPGHHPVALVTAGPDVRQLGTAPVLQSPGMIQLSQSQTCPWPGEGRSHITLWRNLATAKESGRILGHREHKWGLNHSGSIRTIALLESFSLEGLTWLTTPEPCVKVYEEEIFLGFFSKIKESEMQEGTVGTSSLSPSHGLWPVLPMEEPQDSWALPSLPLSGPAPLPGTGTGWAW